MVSAGIAAVIGELRLGEEIDSGGSFGLDSEVVRQIITSSISKTIGILLTPPFKSFVSSLGDSSEGAGINAALQQ